METMKKESKQPVISVIMPAYQAKQYIGQAIASVQNQTCEQAWELLVIDDCSTDGTMEAVRAYAADPRIHYVRQRKNRGVAAARNLGIRLARGVYVAFLDADDWWEEDKLRLQMERMARTEAVLVCTGRELMHPDGTPQGRVIGVPERITYEMLLRTNVIPCGSVLLRTDVAREFWFTCDKYHEDYILWLRILKKYGAAAGVDVPALKCRLSAKGKSRNKWKSAIMQYGSYRYLGYGRIQAFYYMVFYTLHGVWKYFGSSGGRQK
jgi:teichuronic acid biosynthesis glycosyltransferase TuaG